jgi:4-alpha-glucanotransferase
MDRGGICSETTSILRILCPAIRARAPSEKAHGPTALTQERLLNLELRRSGVLLHTTSLPGPHGAGDFGPDAYRFVDWLASAGQGLWQMLPVNPIGPGDSPYQSVSAFAGSPLMVALEPLVANGWLAPPALPAPAFEPQRVDFARVVPWRLARLREAAAGFFAQAGMEPFGDYARWCRREASWLDDYALFMALETAHQGHAWWHWETPYRNREPAALAAAREQHAGEIAFWQFVQWCFETQLLELKRYANQRGVALVGDLPIFIAHHSADCWARPDLYELDAEGQPTVIAGVPPDDLGPLGQRWGNPLYRWDRMAGEGYAWWVDRVQRALAQADIFRIDHFRGFAGYWEIPASSPTAQVGRWVPGPGRPLFDAIEKALGQVPIIAEDLGFITNDVRALREGCGFPGMKILQFAFGGHEPDGSHEFLPHNYKTDAVVYTGTHDNDTARGWWDHAPEHERHNASGYLACGAQDLHWAMIRAASHSVAAMAVFPLQDVLGLGSEHRMNIPGTLGGSNWQWRFEWSQVGSEPGRLLGLIARGSGRGAVAPLTS